jgi:hypothetical protein
MMRRILGLSVVAAMLCVASSALAAPGISMRWQFCSGEGTGTADRTFACASNVGSNTLVFSFELPHDVLQVSGNELVVDFLSQSATMPLWWDFKNPGTCRQGSLGVNVSFDANNVVCADWAQGQSGAGIGAYGTGTSQSMGTIDPALAAQHRRLTMALAVPPTALQDLVTATEYFSCNVTINNQKTIGTTCTGCSEPICIVFNSLRVTTPPVNGQPINDVFIGNASSAGSNIVTWQGTGPDCQLVPTKNKTWGQVKALYR